MEDDLILSMVFMSKHVESKYNMVEYYDAFKVVEDQEKTK